LKWICPCLGFGVHLAAVLLAGGAVGLVEVLPGVVSSNIISDWIYSGGQRVVIA